METCFNYCSTETGFFSSDERRWINKVHKLKEQYPEQITILKEPEDNDGCIYAKVPVKFMKLQGPAKRTPMTEEQKQVLRERFKLVQKMNH
jgi:hypothetical protein